MKPNADSERIVWKILMTHFEIIMRKQPSAITENKKILPSVLRFMTSEMFGESMSFIITIIYLQQNVPINIPSRNFLVIIMWRIPQIMNTRIRNKNSKTLFNYRGARRKSNMSWIHKMRLYTWIVDSRTWH